MPNIIIIVAIVDNNNCLACIKDLNKTQLMQLQYISLPTHNFLKTKTKKLLHDDI